MMEFASRVESNDSWAKFYQTKSRDTWTEQDQIESNDSWTNQNQFDSSDCCICESNDSFDELDTLDGILEDYRPLVIDKYDSSAMMRMLNNAVIWEIVRRSDEAEKLNEFLDGLPTFNKDVMSDMEKWLADSVHEVQAFVNKDFANADWIWCAYFEDLIDFMEKFIIPRLRTQTQEQYVDLPDLKDHVTRRWHLSLAKW